MRIHATVVSLISDISNKLFVVNALKVIRCQNDLLYCCNIIMNRIYITRYATALKTMCIIPFLELYAVGDFSMPEKLLKTTQRMYYVYLITDFHLFLDRM